MGNTFFQFFNGMPTNILKVGKSLNTHVLPKFQERPFQGFSQSGFFGGGTGYVPSYDDGSGGGTGAGQ